MVPRGNDPKVPAARVASPQFAAYPAGVGCQGATTEEIELSKARPGRIRVLLVDDHRLVVEALGRVLATEGFDVVGAVGSVAEVARVEARPDVILMDYVLQDGSGVEATRISRARWPRARVVMLSAVAADEAIAQAVEAGADGYLTKDGALDEVVAAVKGAYRGEVLLPAHVLEDIVERLRAPVRHAPMSEALTTRQLEVLRELAAGSSGETIGRRLGISPETVRTHVETIRRKLGARSRLEAVAVALARGLIDAPRGSVGVQAERHRPG